MTKAAARGYLRICQRLVDAGAEVDHASSTGCTALMISVTYARTAVARLLLDNGANANQAMKNGSTTALSVARWHPAQRQRGLVALLLEYGAR